MEPNQETTEQQSEKEFLRWMRAKWAEVRNVSHGATVSLLNTGDEHTATFECAKRLRDASPQFYDERMGYPRFVVPNQEVSKVLSLTNFTVAMVDYAAYGKDAHRITKFVTLFVAKPSVFLADLSEAELRVAAWAANNPGMKAPEPRVVTGRMPVIRERDKAPAPPNIEGTKTGRFDSSKLNESAMPRRDSEEREPLRKAVVAAITKKKKPLKKIIRER